MRIEAVGSRDIVNRSADLLGALLDELVQEVGGRERRCVISVGSPDAALRVVSLPEMTWAERKSAVRYEAQRLVSWNIEEIPTKLRLETLDRKKNAYLVGAVRRADLAARLAPLRLAGLRPVAADYDAFALRRAFPDADAIVDIGKDRSTIHAYDQAPISVYVARGGDEITQGIASDLSIDIAAAEKRKRILGPAGAGINSRGRLVAELAEGIERSRSRKTISRIALTGNGARLAGLAAALETACNVVVDTSVSALFEGAYPDDVLKYAAYDWTLAAGLASWSLAS